MVKIVENLATELKKRVYNILHHLIFSTQFISLHLIGTLFISTFRNKLCNDAIVIISLILAHPHTSVNVNDDTFFFN